MIAFNIISNDLRKKIISDLFCLHLKKIRKGGYIICINCGTSWKVNNNTGTSK